MIATCFWLVSEKTFALHHFYLHAQELHWAIPEKNPNRRGWGDEISRGTEEIPCGNSEGQVEKKWHFQGVQWCMIIFKNCPLEFAWVLVFDPFFSRIVSMHGSHAKITNPICTAVFLACFFQHFLLCIYICCYNMNLV